MPMTPDPHSLKHKAVYLLPYEPYDGPYADKSDCKFLSVGWAQYDPRMLSVKTLRHTGAKWSRQSEEIPIHRAIDLLIFLASVIRDAGHSVMLPAGTFQNQRKDEKIGPHIADYDLKALEAQLNDPAVVDRLGKLLDVLQTMRSEDRF